MQEIIDVNGKTRTVLSIKKIAVPIPNAVTGDVFTTKEYVEVIIIGKSGRRWVEWYPYERFVVLNPKMVIK